MLNIGLSQNHQTLAKLINDKAIVREGDQTIVSPTGQTQKWLIDLRPILLDVEALDIISNIFWDQYENQLPFQIAGMEVAAVPLVTALLMKAKARGLKTSGLVVRKERKTSGLGKSIEGEITGDPIILVDDIMNSGSSLEKAISVLEQ
ncbi:MAG: phosphoribosyltransferase family protein, partial [Pseudomonadota bacterium]